MGVTSFDIQLLETVIKAYKPKSAIELGAQNNYAQPKLPAPYMSEWYKAKGIDYTSIDLSAENGSFTIDLSKKLINQVPSFEKSNLDIGNYDLVTDFGTSEHIGTDGKFDWEAIYNCWVTKHVLLKKEGIMISENPKTGNWPGHGFNYYTKEFYRQLEAATGYKIILLDEHPAMSNITDGWNVVCIMQKVSDKFVSLEEFKSLDLRQK